KGSLPGAGRSFSNNGNSQVFNINVLITAYFAGNNYEEALRFIAYAIAFLQDKNVFTPQNSPKMEAAIDKLILEIDNLSLDQMSNLWSSIGAK
ncbi:Pvc16 family protein, partial [Acinetobacter baumannii]